MNLSVLQNISKAEVIEHPYPHIIIKDCLPDKIYYNLVKSYPVNLVNNHDNNKRGDIYSYQLLNINDRLWKNFLDYHCSLEFLNEVLSLFEDHLNKIKILEKIQILKKKKINIYPGKNKDSLTMSASASYNTSVTQFSSVRKIHRDKPNKLYSGLLYMRDDLDNTDGGDLELYKNNVVVKKLEYKKNSLIIFINGENSYHGVTPRSLTNILRKFCFFSTILPFDIYKKVNNPFLNFKNKFFKSFKNF